MVWLDFLSVCIVGTWCFYNCSGIDSDLSTLYLGCLINSPQGKGNSKNVLICSDDKSHTPSTEEEQLDPEQPDLLTMSIRTNKFCLL